MQPSIQTYRIHPDDHKHRIRGGMCADCEQTISDPLMRIIVVATGEERYVCLDCLDYQYWLDRDTEKMESLL